MKANCVEYLFGNVEKQIYYIFLIESCHNLLYGKTALSVLPVRQIYFKPWDKLTILK